MVYFTLQRFHFSKFHMIAVDTLVSTRLNIKRKTGQNSPDGTRSLTVTLGLILEQTLARSESQSEGEGPSNPDIVTLSPLCCAAL